MPSHLNRKLPPAEKILAAIVARRRLIPHTKLNYYLEAMCPNGRYQASRDLASMMVLDGFIDRAYADRLRREVASTYKPTILGHYELIARVGEGGMGGVYAAFDKRTGERVAVKVLRKSLARNRNFLRRFFKEAEASLSMRHPNIVRGLDVGEDNGFHYFVMDYVEGKDTDQLVRENGPFDVYDALKIIAEVTRALSCAHRRGMVHRDVKPANIIIDKSGLVRLADFGLIKDLSEDSRLTNTGVAMGTPHFISPEQATGHGKVDHRADLYSLGATLYFLLCGHPPFDGTTPAEIACKHVSARHTPIRRLMPSIPTTVERLVEILLSKEPRDRYQSATRLLRDIEDILAGRRARYLAHKKVRRYSAGRVDGSFRHLVTGALLGSGLVSAAVAGYMIIARGAAAGLLARISEWGSTLAESILPVFK
ncbi:MAG: serine/threonine protein kinase [Planctomycetes bacterium]|nr:serine/threonine protein kinase [Planctomycetota bacterium]